MAGPRKINKGQRLRALPADSWNAFVDTHNIVAQMRGKTNGTGQTTADDRSIVVTLRNDSGEQVPLGGVLRLGSPLTTPSTRAEVVLEGLLFSGVTPLASGDQAVGFALAPVPNGDSGPFVIPGATWVQVSVTNAGHKFAKPKASVAELQSDDSSGYPFVWKESGTGGGKWSVISLVRDFAVTVYEFRNCTDALATLYLDNPTIAEHDPGEVAVLEQDGFIDCWRLYGPAPFCKTGQCANILAWKDECVSCYYLTPCGGGSPTFVRERVCGEWAVHDGKIVKLDGPGHEGCYTVAKAGGCFDVNEALGPEHIVDVYEHCDACGCYELTNCADEEDVIFVSGDLATAVGQTSGEDSIGEHVKRRGVCWEITGFANPCGTEPEVWDMDEVDLIESCSGCCYLLTPCEGQAGDPEPIYLKLKSTDEINPEDFLNGDASNGRVVMLAGYVCYTWSVPEVCDEEEVIVGIPTILEEFDSCELCVITCWKECGTTTYIRTYSDMGDVGPNAAVKRAEDGKCYVRETSPGTCGTPSIVAFTIQTIIDEGEDSCTICATPKVELVPDCGSGCGDCSGSSSGGSGSGASTIVTDNAAFFEHVGKFIKMDGVCRRVNWTTAALAGTVGCWTGPFTSCEACAAAPSQITVIALVDGEHKNVTLQGVFNVCGQSALDECEA